MPRSVLETRTRAHGLKHRKISDDGAIYWTVEVPLSVLTGVAPSKRLAHRMERWRRHLQQMKTKARAEAMLREGIKPIAVAHELGLSEGCVHKYRRNMR